MSTLVYAIRKVPGNQMGLKLNGARQLLIYDMKLLGDNRHDKGRHRKIN
jgi:hypothetical protein